MTRWTPKLVHEEGGWGWYFCTPKATVSSKNLYQTEAAARRAAISWLRRALQQAGKRVEG
jgi:hypothetical protein